MHIKLRVELEKEEVLNKAEKEIRKAVMRSLLNALFTEQEQLDLISALSYDFYWNGYANGYPHRYESLADKIQTLRGEK